MSAIFNNTQHTSGYNVGSNSLGRLFVTVLSLMLIGYNAVHLHDYALVMFVNEDTWIVKEIAIRVAAVGLAFLEIVIGGVFVYLYRTRESILNGGLILTGFLALVVASMAVIAGNGSQQSKADTKTNLINAHESKLVSVESKIRAAKSELDMSLRMANQIAEPNQRAIEKDRANLNYENTISRLNIQKASMQTGKPIQPIENGSTLHYIAITLFSILCSFGALFLSGYSAAFLKPLVAIPAFSLMSKLRHEWQSDGSDFKTVQHHVSPLGGLLSGLIKTQKALPRQQQKDNLTSNSGSDTGNHPEPVDTTLGAVSNTEDSAGRRPPNDETVKPETVEYSEGHYDVIKSRIIHGDIKPTQKPVKAELVKLKVRFVDDAARQKKAVEILEQLKGEGVITDNPDFGKSGQVVAKFILNPDYVKEGSKAKTKPKKVIVNCPKCDELLKVSEHKLTEWDNKLKCRKCKQVFNVERA